MVDAAVRTSEDERVPASENKPILGDLEIVVVALEEVFVGIEASSDQFFVVGDVPGFEIVELTDDVSMDSQRGLIEIVHCVKMDLGVMLARSVFSYCDVRNGSVEGEKFD